MSITPSSRAVLVRQRLMCSLGTDLSRDLPTSILGKELRIDASFLATSCSKLMWATDPAEAANDAVRHTAIGWAPDRFLGGLRRIYRLEPTRFAVPSVGTRSRGSEKFTERIVFTENRAERDVRGVLRIVHVRIGLVTRSDSPARVPFLIWRFSIEIANQSAFVEHTVRDETPSPVRGRRIRDWVGNARLDDMASAELDYVSRLQVLDVARFVVEVAGEPILVNAIDLNPHSLRTRCVEVVGLEREDQLYEIAGPKQGNCLSGRLVKGVRVLSRDNGRVFETPRRLLVNGQFATFR